MNRYKWLLLLLAALIGGPLNVSSTWLPIKEKELRCGEHILYPRRPKPDQSPPGEFPFLVQIKAANETAGRKCVGTIIKSNILVTSDSCLLEPKDETSYRLSLGDISWDSEGSKVLESNQVSYKPQFEHSHYQCFHDGGILPIYLAPRLNYQVNTWHSHQFINRICMDIDDTSKNTNLTGHQVLVVGWTQPVFENQKARVHEYTVRECRGEERRDDVICLNKRIKDNYLLGSPLIRRNAFNEWDLVGIYTKLGEKMTFVDVRKRLLCYPIRG